ncbi:MAG TPA: HIT domain-containing protein [Terriglobia bacterium]|nr:HIT domain-containing protein [Terriglobia bacterium]
MDYLWSPWRYRYVTEEKPSSGCVFCQKASEDNDERNFILYRGLNNFVLLNIYPYTSGHLMIAPFQHIGQLAATDDATWIELAMLTRKAEQALQIAYKPEGINLGMNLGKSAGAGIADHIHMHVLPRWHADSNFLTVIGETRVLPEALEDTYRKLKPLF